MRGKGHWVTGINSSFAVGQPAGSVREQMATVLTSGPKHLSLLAVRAIVCDIVYTYSH